MRRGYKDMIAEADAAVTSVTPEEMAQKLNSGEIVMVDIRDPRELERDGMVPDAFHAPRGMLEFWIDPESPYHKPRFAEGKTYVFFCAGGMRSLLAAKVAQEMGLDSRSMLGGFRRWKQEGHPTVSRPPRSPKA